MPVPGPPPRAIEPFDKKWNSFLYLTKKKKIHYKLFISTNTLYACAQGYACADASVNPQDLPVGFLMHRLQRLPACTLQPWPGEDSCRVISLACNLGLPEWRAY